MDRGLKFYGGDGHGHKSGLTPPETPELAKIRREFEGKLDQWFDDFMNRVVSGEEAGVSLAASDLATLNAKLNELAMEYLKRLSAVGVEAGALEIAPGFDVKPVHSIAYLNGYVPKLVDAVTRETAIAVRDAIREGLEQGQSIPQMTEAIRKEIPEAARWKAERIARTESAHAYTRGKVDAWKQSGVTMKEWVLSGNPCEVCEGIAAANPEPIPVDQVFYSDDWFGTGNVPAHPNCACDVAPVYVPAEVSQ